MKGSSRIKKFTSNYPTENMVQMSPLSNIESRVTTNLQDPRPNDVPPEGLLGVEAMEAIQRNLVFIAREPTIAFDHQYINGHMNEELNDMQKLVNACVVSPF